MLDKNLLKIIFIGDISGKTGREAIKKILPRLKKKYSPDLIIANAENAAHGTGVTEKIIKELIDAGINYFTTGDHAFDKEKQFDVYKKYPIIRPANYPEQVPGKGYIIIALKNNHKLLLINLIGRVFMRENFNCPFKTFDEILANNNLSMKNYSAIIVDIHAEATSEKIAFKHYVDGRASAVLGTHTHVQTSDEMISSQGTAYITDVGMTGAYEECLGVEKEGIIKTFLTQIKHHHIIPEKGPAILNGSLISINLKNNKAVFIKRICEYITIK